MRAMTYYDKLLNLCDYVFKHGSENFNDWKLVDYFSATDGLFISVYKTSDNEYIFCIRGTEIKTEEDREADRQLASHEVPNQYKSALEYYKQVKDKYAPMIFVGYSLGGIIAQMLGNDFGNETICFEPFGVGGIVSAKNTRNITNFGNWYDEVFIADFENQLGRVFIMDVKPTKNGKAGFLKHLICNCGRPSKSTEYLGERSNDSLYQTLLDTQDTVQDVKKTAKDYVKPGYLQTKKLGKDILNGVSRVLNQANGNITDTAKQMLLQGGISLNMSTK